MSHEIYYTSAPEGLKPGSSGFCTVGISENIPKSLWDRLETLSAYRHHFNTAAGHPGENPVSYAHWLLNIAGANYHVLSRVCDSGVDHTQRANAFADHLVLENAELAAGGPAWMLMQDLLADEWGGEVGTLPPRTIPQGDTSPAICTRWKEATGDAGWAGHLADLFVKTPTKPICILFAPGQDILPLIAEAIALLPASARWLVTFNTYFTSMPTSATCAWRCCLAGSPAAQLGMRYASSGLILDLTDPSHIGTAPDGPYATLARTGVAPVATPTKPKPIKPGKPVAKPVKTEGIYDFDDDDEDEEKEFEFDLTEPTEEPAGSVPVPPSVGEAKPKPPVKRLKPIMREADAALRKAELSADHGAARRRKQFVVLFFCAIAALGIGMALVIIAMRGSGPPETLPTGTTNTALVPTPQTLAAVPTPTPPTSIPAPIIPKTLPAPTTKPVVIPPITPIPTPTPVVIHYPAFIRLPDVIKKPSSTRGTGDDRQQFSFPITDIDPALPVTALHLQFPGESISKSQFGDPDTLGGTLIASDTTNRLQLSVRWKASNDPGPGSEILLLTYTPDRPRASLELDWKIAPLTSKPDSVPAAYWALQNSTIDLVTSRGSKQKLAFQPYTPPTINLLDAQTSFQLPCEIPAAALPMLASPLPNGWTVSPYVTKPHDQGALMSTSTQGLAFKKSGGAVDTYFVVTFDSTYQKVDCNFSQRLSADQDELKKDQVELQSLTDAVEQATKNNNGKLPDDPATKKTADDRDTLLATVEAYKAVVAGYNDINQIDIALELPGKAQVVTYHLRRVEK